MKTFYESIKEHANSPGFKARFDEHFKDTKFPVKFLENPPPRKVVSPEEAQRNIENAFNEYGEFLKKVLLR